VGLYERILVPIEGSQTDGPVLAHVRELASTCGAEVYVLRVAHYHTRDERTHELDDAEADLRRAAEALGGGGFPVHTILGHGEPAEQIIAQAEELGADLIAMATHGHRWLGRLVYGSVADHIRHGADVPLLLIRARSAEEELGERD
jgi:nucleotide-binding universal stress UspA family protein